MKQILAIIRMNKVNATKQALIEAGFPRSQFARRRAGAKAMLIFGSFTALKTARRKQSPASKTTVRC